MNYIEDIKLINSDKTVNAIIEIPKGTKSKFELKDKTFDKVVEVRKIKYKYPFYYGCFPETHAGDDDPLDMVLLTNRKRNQLDIVRVYPIAVLKTIDNGEVDDKIFVIDVAEPIKNINKLLNKSIKFLKKYKGKHSNTVVDNTIYDMEEANKLILAANKRYKNLHNISYGDNNKFNNLKITL